MFLIFGRNGRKNGDEPVRQPEEDSTFNLQMLLPGKLHEGFGEYLS